MTSSTADALADLAAVLVVSTRQWQTEKSTKASTVPIEDDIRAIEEQIEQVSDTVNLSTPDRSKLDSVGTELWNVWRIHMMEACTDEEERKTKNGRVLAVAVALLDLASPSNAPGTWKPDECSKRLRNMWPLKGVVFASVPEPRGYVWWLQLINAADTNQLDCSLKILKAAAKRFDSLEGDSSAIDKVQLDSITAEYYMLRVYLAWKQGRPDIADHLFTKVPLKATIKNRSTIVEQCLCIGRMALETDQHETSAKWLEIALGQLHENQDDEALISTDFDFYIRHHLGQSCGQ
ncbi:hypothetical protein PENSUB_10786 [Penicillium subrubescens]|uniref:Protein ZIP4 homolog n=1 Tax=Penicillium subrubescens TaxID=1316194 RepID=A0A1Q5T8P8_9EURO|nr:hypothetical protein PENSUB_10786 [Penicillium subrubescens]